MKNFEEIINELMEMVGRKSVTIEPDQLSRFRVDHLTPQAVVFPKNTRQISDVIRLAHTHNLGLIPWGSGTHMAMGNQPKRLDLVLSTSRMNHIIDVDTANLTITVEAGVKFRDIQARLATQEDRCYLPLEDLATESDEVICSDRSHSGSFLPMDPPPGGQSHHRRHHRHQCRRTPPAALPPAKGPDPGSTHGGPHGGYHRVRRKNRQERIGL